MTALSTSALACAVIWRDNTSHIPPAIRVPGIAIATNGIHRVPINVTLITATARLTRKNINAVANMIANAADNTTVFDSG